MRRRLRVRLEGPAVGEYLVARWGPAAIPPGLGRDSMVAVGIHVTHVTATLAGELGELELDVTGAALPDSIDSRDAAALIIAGVQAVNMATGDLVTRSRQASIEVSYA